MKLQKSFLNPGDIITEADTIYLIFYLFNFNPAASRCTMLYSYAECSGIITISFGSEEKLDIFS